MKLGFGLVTCQRYPGDPRTDRQLYAEALELSVLAENLGFDSVWVSEHHFVDDGYMPSLLPMCAAIAARTRRIEIGTGLLLAALHDPVRLAEDGATVDLISGGRLILGLGLGWREEEFEGFGIPLRDRVPRLVDTVAVLRQAWAGEPVTGGSHLSYPGVFVTPRPPRPGGPPIWIGAMSEPAVRRAGRIADGLMATDVTPGMLAQQVAWAREAREAAGADPSDLAVGLHLPTFPWRGDVDEAWERVRPFHRYIAWKYDDMEFARARGGGSPAPPPTTADEETALREGIVIGTPEQVADQVRRLADAAGGDAYYVARLYWPGMELSLQREIMHLWAEEVAPLLR